MGGWGLGLISTGPSGGIGDRMTVAMAYLEYGVVRSPVPASAGTGLRHSTT
jgi:hypothetical protein